jgi:SPP1 gp7 family putative phage head morphogenesis protein
MASQIELAVENLSIRRRRPRKVRPARFPLNVERQYAAEHRGVIQDLGSIVGELLLPRLEEIARLGGFRADAGRMDQSQWRSLLQSIFGEMRGRWEFAAARAEELAEDTSNQISDFNRRQIGKQLRAAVGVDVFFQDTELQDTMEQFATDNVSRITTYPATIFPTLERIVANGYRSGLRASAIRDQIVEQLGVEESRASFWARDQIGSLNAQLTKQRQESVGIEEYIWRTSQDERVRASHRRLEGTKHSWDDPPKVGKRLVHPGEDYNCRCTADPVIPGVENIKTSAKDVPRDPELVKRFRARARRRRERNKEKRLTAA